MIGKNSKKKDRLIEVEIIACMSLSLLCRDFDDQGVEGNSL